VKIWGGSRSWFDSTTRSVLLPIVSAGEQAWEECGNRRFPYIKASISKNEGDKGKAKDAGSKSKDNQAGEAKQGEKKKGEDDIEEEARGRGGDEAALHSRVGPD
jgi:hypothetical protein